MEAGRPALKRATSFKAGRVLNRAVTDIISLILLLALLPKSCLWKFPKSCQWKPIKASKLKLVVASGAESTLKEFSDQKADDRNLVCQEDQSVLLCAPKAEDQATLLNAETCAPLPGQKEAQISEQTAEVTMSLHPERRSF